MEQLVLEQEAMVENIDQRGEEVTTNVVKAQEEIGVAVEKARSRRRKKWWCLLIVRKYILFYITFRALFSQSFPCYLALPSAWGDNGSPFYHGTSEDNCHHHPDRCANRCNCALKWNQIPPPSNLYTRDSGVEGKTLFRSCVSFTISRKILT